MMERLFPAIRYKWKKKIGLKKSGYFLNKPHSRYKQKREVKSSSLSFSVDNSALFQHSNTFDMMCLGEHTYRILVSFNEWNLLQRWNYK